MPSQVIVPHRPGPLVAAPQRRPSEPADWQPGGAGATEVALAAGGGVLLVAVFATGLPPWLSVVAVAALALGAGLPGHAAFLRARHRRAERKAAGTLAQGIALEVSEASVRRLVAAYERLRRTTGRGAALDAGHLAMVEVARLLGGRAPEEEQTPYVIERAEAVSALADRLARGPLPPPAHAAPDSLTRIAALLA